MIESEKNIRIVLVGVAICLGLLAHQTNAATESPDEPSALTCDCTDVDVRALFISAVEYTCWQQYKYGGCNQAFMKQSIKEVPEGYCQITCGRCACCKDLAAVAAGAGLNEFLWAMNRTTDRVEALHQPGIAATLLAPDDNAMKSLFDKLGGKQKIDSDPALKAKLANIMAYHVVQPLPGFEAWTTPFFTAGTKLTTFAKNQTVEVVGGGDGGSIKIKGAGGSADIQKKDMYACKGYVNIISWYLMPPGEDLA